MSIRKLQIGDIHKLDSKSIPMINNHKSKKHKLPTIVQQLIPPFATPISQPIITLPVTITPITVANNLITNPVTTINNPIIPISNILYTPIVIPPVSLIPENTKLNEVSKNIEVIENKVSENCETIKDIICNVPMIDHIYCINLESCKDRKEHMKKEFKRNNFNANFVNAIHPGHSEHKKKYHNPKFTDQSWNTPRCYCVNKCTHRARKLRTTEVAISLSHHHIYQKIVKNNDKWALVCEDDLIFIDNFCEIINKAVPKEIWNEYNTRPIIIFLGARDNYHLKINQPENFEFVNLQNGTYSNYCYILNNSCAQHYIKKFFPISRPEDSFKRYWIGKNYIHSYKIKPSLVAELSAGTNMKSIYNRWSLHQTPGKNKEEHQSFPNAFNFNHKNTKRLITFNKNRHTNMINDAPVHSHHKKKSKSKYKLNIPISNILNISTNTIENKIINTSITTTNTITTTNSKPIDVIQSKSNDIAVPLKSSKKLKSNDVLKLNKFNKNKSKSNYKPLKFRKNNNALIQKSIQIDI